MLALIRFFIDLCLLRRNPQDLPASSTLLWVALAADASIGALVAAGAGIPLGPGLIQVLVDVALMLALLYGALQLLGRLPRFIQSATALLGSGAVVGALALVPVSLIPSGEQTEQSGVAALLFLVVIAWSILVTGHILRHTFDIRLGQGAAVAVLYNLLSYSLVGGLFSGS